MKPQCGCLDPDGALSDNGREACLFPHVIDMARALYVECYMRNSREPASPVMIAAMDFLKAHGWQYIDWET